MSVHDLTAVARQLNRPSVDDWAWRGIVKEGATRLACKVRSMRQAQGAVVGKGVEEAVLQELL